MSVVTIHLLTFNGERFVQECLASVFAQTYPHVEVLATDNASTDRTKNVLNVICQKSKVKCYFSEKNLGFAAGHNHGIRQSRGEYVLCLNQDVVLDKDFVKYAVEAMASDPKIGAVQGKLLRATQDQIPDARHEIRDTIDTVGLQPFRSRRFVNRGQGEIDTGQYGEAEEIFGADGAAPLYRRSALEYVKLPIPNTKYEYFDEDFFLYKEDIDLAWRLRLGGWKTVYEPRAVGWHGRSAHEKSKAQLKQNYFGIVQARREIPPYAQYHSFKNQRFLLLKNDSPWYFIKHLPWALPYEIASWLWVVFFEPKTLRAMVEVLRRAPGMLQKRARIEARRRVPRHSVYHWFR